MNSYLQVPLKKTQAVDFVKPLSNYIKNTFSGEVLNENKDVLAELNQLRGNAVVKTLDKHETSLEVLQRYYDQLVTMEAKLPITEDQIRVSLTWYDAFDKGSIFGSTKCSLSSGHYERFCVLFNIAGLMSQLAYAQNHTTDDGLKTAARYYQQAAGIFTYLKDNVYPVLQTLPTPDFAVGCLTTLSAIMLAQAQDCFCKKATADKMKDAIVAKLAMQASDFYQEAVRTATHEVKGLWEKEWLPTLQCKQNFFLAIAEYHQSKVNFAAGSYGEQVGRLQKADKYINDAMKLGANFTPSEVKTLASNITKELTSAKKDNELIYLERILTPDQLTAVSRAALAKALPVSSPMTSDFKDLFTKLVPMAVHQAISAYDNAKAVIINTEVGKLREATQFLNGILTSLNLPAAIEDLSGEKIPQSVLDKANEVKGKGGLQSIDNMMQNLPDLLTRNREVLDETLRMMDEEERDDTQMRDHFKERWVRTPSTQLTPQLRSEGAKYKGILDNATGADQIVKDKYNEHRRCLEILAKPNAEIAASLPKGDASISGAGGEAVNELKNFMNEVQQTKKQREEIETEFKSTTVDIQSKFLQALAAEGYLDVERISNQNIDEGYGSLRTQVAEILQNQQQLIDKIHASNQKFVAAKQGHGTVNERDQMLKDLAAAYDAYIELSANLKEGAKFYNDLTEILLKYQSKVNDLVFARRTEKDDLSKDLQQQAAKGTGAASPSIPSHHQNQQPPEQPPKPARPPPPNQQPQQQQQQPIQPQPSQQPSYNPSAPYPTQPAYMPQPGYYAPPGGAQQYAGGYYPQPGYAPPSQGYQPYPYQQMPPQQQPGGQYIPPYAQQQQMGYQGYQQYQQQQPRQ